MRFLRTHQLFNRTTADPINCSGINLSQLGSDNFADAFQEERARFITLSPQQWFRGPIDANSKSNHSR